MTDLQPPPPQDNPRPRRWLRVVLVVSLAANLAVAGLVLGLWLSHFGPQHPGGKRHSADDRMVRELGFGPYARAIPRGERASLKEAVAEHRSELRANRDALRSAFEATLATLRTEPFDRAAMAAQMEAQRRAISANRKIGQDILLDKLAALTPAERTAFADRLERGLGREPGRRAEPTE